MNHRACRSFATSPKHVEKYTIYAVIHFPEAQESHTQTEKFVTSDVDVLLSRAGENSNSNRKSPERYIRLCSMSMIFDKLDG